MSDLTAPLAVLVADSPPVEEAYDTSTREFAAFVDRVEAEFAMGSIGTPEQVDALLRTEAPDAIGVRVAAKIAQSRQAVRAVSEPVVVTLLNPVYKETGRMQPRDEHPHGEDSIRYKAAALDWITELNPNIQTRFVVIDDGCPDGSGIEAAALLAGLSGWEDRHEVLFLEDAREAGDPDVPPGLTAKSGDRRSVKGGAVLYGMRRALRLDTDARHIIVDNDADLSILPDQLGLVLEGILDEGFDVIAGSRREQDSVALIGGSRATRGSLFIGVWQYLLPELGKVIIDTNRAFKAFDATALARIIDDMQIYTFPYQIEILQAAISRGLSIAPRGIAYVDSEAASTQQGETITETYLDQVHQVVDIAQRHGTVSEGDALLQFLDGVDDPAWLEIEQNPPAELLNILRI